MKIGAHYSEKGIAEFTVWAPFAKNVELVLLSRGNKKLPMQKNNAGYWTAQTADVFAGDLYLYRLDREMDRPDPASHSQPLGVHDASAIVDHNTFRWKDDRWKGVPLPEMIIYEIHIGTFTKHGKFDDLISQLDDLRDLGINTIEIMPVAQFPGERNWGYDGVYPFAVQNYYGGPEGLKKLVNDCHRKEIAVILDVVYNHLGPEGNYLRDFGPYFTDRYRTPWGEAINFDGPYNNEVRNLFIENALYWFKHFHIDALRLDAIHGIHDNSDHPFLLELSEAVKDFSEKSGREYYLIAESDLNDSGVVRSKEEGGYALNATWCDDFHHALHTILTGEHNGYYMDFGRIDDLVKSLREGFVYSGQYSAYRKRNHGNLSGDIPPDRFVVFSQNHDQIGNRINGERLSSLVSFESLKLAAGIVILSPYIPLLFMGEEYGETAPFLYFTSHTDPGLIRGVREGRKKEFESFKRAEDSSDPQSEITFLRSKINRDNSENGDHKILLDFYKRLIELRKDTPALANLDRDSCEAWSEPGSKIIFMQRSNRKVQALLIFNFGKIDKEITPEMQDTDLKKLLASSDKRWGNSGALAPEEIKPGERIIIGAESFVVYVSER